METRTRCTLVGCIVGCTGQFWAVVPSLTSVLTVCLMTTPATGQAQSTSFPDSPSVTTTANPGELLWTIFPQDLYDSSDFPQEFPYLVAGAAAILLAIVLALGIGCYFIERKRRIDASLIAKIAENRRKQEQENTLAEQERQQADQERRRRQAEQEEAARREAAVLQQENATAKSDKDEEKAQTVSAPPDDSDQTIQATDMNWGMDTSFIF